MSSGEMTLAHRWEAALEQFGANPFLVFEDSAGAVTEWSYREFDEVVCQAAGVLAAAGVSARAPVHLVVRNCPAFVATWLACARWGAWMVPVDPASTARDIRRQVDRVRPAVGVLAIERAAVYAAGSQGSGIKTVELSETAADVAPGGPLGRLEPGDRSQICARPTDRLAVMFTSGTTSEPKGVVLTQHNYAYVADTMAAMAQLQPRHRWLVTLPLFHANAQYYCIAPAIAVGASVALTATFSASRWLHQADDLRATHASLFASPIRMILARRPSSAPVVRLEHVWYAQNIGAEHHAEFAQLVGCRPRQLYGMTETVAIVCADVSQPYRNDVIGPPITGRVVEVRDPQTGLPVADGEPGELTLAGTPGEDLFLEYLDDPSTTSRSFTDRAGGVWFHTGDLVVRPSDDPHGAFRFVGRRDDVIKVAGENVSLTEVEAVLAQAPGVLECAVVGQADPVRDVVPVAYVVARNRDNPPAPDDLAQYAMLNLAPAARPRDWHLIDELPRTSVGKVRRFTLDA